MNAPYNINKPFNTIINQIDMEVEVYLSDAGKLPYMTEQVMTTA